MSETTGGDVLFYAFVLAALHNPLWETPEDAQSVLDNAQVTKNINITKVGGYSWLGCGLLSAGYHTEFKGNEITDDGSLGIEINGVVCEGIFGDSYIRYKHDI